MAVVGEAHIVVRAITTGIGPEIKRAFEGIGGDVDRVGRDAGKTFNRGVSKGLKKDSGLGGWFRKIKDGAEGARQAWIKMQKTGLWLQAAMGTLAGSIGSLVASLGSLIGSLGAAAPALVAVGGAAIGAGIGMKLAGMALSGVTGPMNQVGKAASGTKKTVKELREEMQQLRFDAEEAALSEQEAALNLEKARSSLARVQDLPPNSMARREAELAYEQADLALRRAIDRNNDLQDEIKNGVKDTADASSGVDPYAGLTKSQKAFAQLLVKLKPNLDKLKEAVASGFLPVLGRQLEKLLTGPNFGKLESMFTKIGDSLGVATDKVFGFINSSKGMGLFESLFDSSSKTIESMGDIFADLLEAMLTILQAAEPVTRKFVGWLVTAADKFNALIGKSAKDGSLTTFFEKSANVAKDFGDIIKNIFGGFGALIADSLEPGSGGDMLLEYLKDATAGFASMGEDKAGLRKFLQDAATNTISMLKALGGIVKAVIGVADNPKIGQFWDAIGKNGPALETFLNAGIDAAPAMGELLGTIGSIVASLSDSGTITAFFDTLNFAAGLVKQLVDSDFVKWIQSWYGPIHGALLAFSTIAGVFTFVMQVVVGSIVFIWGKLKMLWSIFKFIWNVIKLIGLAIRIAFMANPIGLIITAIGILIAALVWFFTQTETGKKVWKALSDFIMGALKAIGDFFVSVWNGIVAFFKPVIDTIVGIFKFAFDIISAYINIIKAIFTIVFVAIAWVVQWVWDGIKAGFKAVAAFLMPILTGIGDFFTGVFTAIGDFIGGVWEGISAGFQAFIDFIRPGIDAIFGFFKTVFDNVANFFKGIINTLIGWAEGFVNFFIKGLNWIIDKINTIKLDIPPILQPLMGGQKSIGFNLPKVAEIKLPRLAEGGVVSPSMGGTIAQIAEAGRPERVEPLDENGLSKRDKVIIDALGGGSGGVNITVNPSADMDENALAALVSRRLAFELRKGAIA